MNLPALLSQFEQGQLFRHTDGGYYQYEKSVYFTEDQDELVIYKHIWPFEESEWARRYSEFKDKFTPITFEDLYAAKKVVREVLQKQIRDNKAKRKQAKE